MNSHVQYLTDEKGKKTAVVLPLSEYEELLENLHDLAVAAARKNEPRESLAEVRALLIRKGVLRG